MSLPNNNQHNHSELRCPLCRAVLATALTASLLSGCASSGESQTSSEQLETQEVEQTPVATEEPQSEQLSEAEQIEEEQLERREEAQARGLDLDDPLDAAMLEDPDEEENPLAIRRIQFAFDSSVVSDKFIPVVEAHGEYLADNPNRKMTVEGHTDERGSREYNLALGERRAEAVKRLLIANGASREQIEVVSYGEEDPLIAESNEQAWAENRRAELIYAGGE